jgi:anion-transporting  ArsA/GET3 family ATPase
MNSLRNVLESGRLVVVTGSGGVGKTTMSAALGAYAASQYNRRVLVLTVDPARRLADALGLESFGNAVVEIESSALMRNGVPPAGRMFAAMIDTKASWDELIARCAPNAEVRDKVLSNKLYRNLTERFVNSHDYIAMERLFEAQQSNDYDLVIVDTPPSRNALDVLDAPRRMKEFFASRLLKLLTSQAQSRLFSLASKPFFLVADRILGARFLSDITEFFTLFRTMEDGFVKRANEVEAVLKQQDTSFMVVTTLESGPLHEAEFLIDALRERGFSLNTVIANRVTPQELVSQAQAALIKLEASIQDPSFVQAVVQATEGVEPTSDQISRVVSTIARKSAEAVRKGQAEQTTLEDLRARSKDAQAELCICAISGADIARATALVALGESVHPA